MCGEQSTTSKSCLKSMGSPPRVRGTGGRITTRSPSCRITPACAGNRCQELPPAPPDEDHPRVCGEQGIFLRQRPGAAGSPPRVRGTVLRAASRITSRRITPACAGNSNRCRNCSRRSQDHPRVCGEQDGLTVEETIDLGSPPRVRGTVSQP